MSKLYVLIAILIAAPMADASKLSQYLRKQEARQQERQREDQMAANQQLQKDMNFQDFTFRLVKRYGQGAEQCRDYEFRSRNDPFLHGYFTACN